MGNHIPTSVKYKIVDKMAAPQKAMELVTPSQLDRLRQLANRQQIAIGYANALTCGRLSTMIGITDDQGAAHRGHPSGEQDVQVDPQQPANRNRQNRFENCQ